MNDNVTIITGLTARDRRRAFSWALSLPEDQLTEIFQDAVKKAYQLKHEHPNLPGKINKYCAFVVAIRNFGWDTVHGKGYRVAQNKQFLDFSHLRKARAAELIRKGRVPILRKKVLAYWGEITELRNEGMGFRSISCYLAKKRKIKVSATYLNKLWKEVILTND